MSKKNDMLGPAIRAMVGVPVQFLGMILDLCNKLAGTDGKLWYEKLGMMLREGVATVVEATTQTLTVLDNIPLATRITAGKYDLVNENVTEQNFPHDPSSDGDWEWKLLHFGQSTSSKNAVSAITADGWQPALLEHLLAFGEKYPDEQRKYPIVALGSSCTVHGRRDVPILWFDRTERSLGLFYWFGVWFFYSRFLVVRRKV